ncbi:Predicted nuclease of the RNAse H fold, HicB family [Desulfomicrobium apsheronum]|jgi:predicted HicB family RNase H-like nuclease|uniref:Predicted nuclease of the RNAse H fold, HicB family n=1 Tax=Desulfomicrobium apsheronum TaxID=52560 RepID=A0A1I3W4A8_9BACT|nr:type II toxin-antitoxin system HicB family antitoxin [Desulfomicrobium apsheronum]SFK02474.1 Predicted nuclease of the RNAse H fold, HicB family [Desulfomicrobium apsheronum]
MNAMKYKGYTARMDFDAEDNILVGKILDIEDVIVFHAESVHEFQTAFHTAIDDYIAACEKLNQKPEKPASGRLMLRINPQVHAAALRKAAHESQSLNKWAEKVIEQATRI